MTPAKAKANKFFAKKPDAKKAINEDDARGYRKRKVNADRIKAGKPKVTSVGEKRKQDEAAGRMNKFISAKAKKKPY